MTVTPGTFLKGEIDISDFIPLVRSFQLENDRRIIDRITNFMKEDLHLMKEIGENRRERLNLPCHSAYIAYRVNVLRNKLFKSDGFREKKTSFDINDLYWYNKDLQFLGYELSPRDNFAAFFDHYDAIKEYLGTDITAKLQFFIQEFSVYMAEVDRIEWKKDEIEQQVVIPALEIALSKVNTDRTEKEIVSYVNQSLEWDFFRLQRELYGIKRLVRTDEDGVRHSIYVTPTFNESDIYRMILDDAAFDNNRWGSVYGSLTVSQRQLVDSVHDVIVSDFKEQSNNDNYKVSEDGIYRIQYRYMAQRIGLEESDLRKKLTRIRKKVNKCSG